MIQRHIPGNTHTPGLQILDLIPVFARPPQARQYILYDVFRLGRVLYDAQGKAVELIPNRPDDIFEGLYTHSPVRFGVV